MKKISIKEIMEIGEILNKLCAEYGKPTITEILKAIELRGKK